MQQQLTGTLTQDLPFSVSMSENSFLRSFTIDPFSSIISSKVTSQRPHQSCVLVASVAALCSEFMGTGSGVDIGGAVLQVGFVSAAFLLPKCQSHNTEIHVNI